MDDLKAYNLKDQRARDLAATTFNQNIVVTAGAGTGKTSLLVNRLVHLLMRDPDPIQITQVVALTFTNKAANEMKTRLREELESYIKLQLDTEAQDEKGKKTRRQVQYLRDRYRLKKEEVDDRAAQALRQLERSDIGTIHSFAASLLRLYPLESGVDPDFNEGEASALDKYFEAQWANWLAEELSYQSLRKEKWKAALGRFSLDEIHDLALALCADTVPLERLETLLHQKKPPLQLRAWLEKLERLAAGLNVRHPGSRNIEVLTRTAGEIFREIRVHHGIPPDLFSKVQEALNPGKTVSKVRGWEEDEVEQARALVRVARRLLQMDVHRMQLLHELLVPFVVPFRARFLKTGAISFDGLLVRARKLVRDRPSVRQILKKRFRAILIDEFQDTDPVQYEILLYLSERLEKKSTDWRKVCLEPGKLFVVGDPKQSIYGFRRADISAYLHVVQDLIEAQGGMHLKLTTNFRSHANILNVVNGVFERLILHKEGFQPPYVGISSPNLETISPPGLEHHPFRSVVLRCVRGEGEKMKAELARRLEGEAIARWLSEEVLGKALVLNREGKPVAVQRKDVAILMRTLTHVHDVLEPLKKRGIRYVVEGEKRFFACQEVIDAINLLRTIADPEDCISLVGVLRSALGGFSDAEIYTLGQKNLLDYRIVSKTKSSASIFADLARIHPAVKALYLCLDRLNQETQTLPVGEAVARVFTKTPMMILAAESLHGEQAVANLEKIRQMAEVLGEEGRGTFRQVIRELERSVKEMKEEGENPLAEETVDAVKIFSVHKAKGLEFPVVVLAGCHSAGNRGGGDHVRIWHDWFSDLVGHKVGENWDLSGIYLAEKEKLREAEEQKRLLYVAMTRAREHLMISCASTRQGEHGSFLSMLTDSTGDLIEGRHAEDIRERKARINTVILRNGHDRAAPRIRATSETATPFSMNWKDYKNKWTARIQRYDETLKRAFFVTPTSLQQRAMAISQHGPREIREPLTGNAALIGQLAHRFLQDWDFSSNPESFHDALLPFLHLRLEGIPEVKRAMIQGDLEEIFEGFFRSSAYETICHAKVLGREIPFLISWKGRVMEGVIDLIYEKNNRLYVVDYKTDRVGKKDLRQVAEGYRYQTEIYPEAVRRSLQRDVTDTRLIFLRVGKIIKM